MRFDDNAVEISCEYSFTQNNFVCLFLHALKYDAVRNEIIKCCNFTI